MTLAKFLFLLAISISNIQAKTQTDFHSKNDELIFHFKNSEINISNSYYLNIIWEGLDLKAENLGKL